MDDTEKLLVENVGKSVTGEELSYVANSTEWARRTRELRTEEGFPISTKMSGNPSLPVGVYVLEQDRQTPKHDRHIPEPVRRQAIADRVYEMWAVSENLISDSCVFKEGAVKYEASGEDALPIARGPS
ncbi:MAG: hypothetical protein WD342_06140 [Verrucomicrobiales bacterium]